MSGLSTEGASEWGHEGGDGHGYRYQYIGPIHYLCECSAYFLNRDRWIAHKALERAATAIERDMNHDAVRNATLATAARIVRAAADTT